MFGRGTTSAAAVAAGGEAHMAYCRHMSGVQPTERCHKSVKKVWDLA